MGNDFDEMEQHSLALMEFCTEYLSQILEQYSATRLDIKTEFSVDTSINAKSVLNSGKYKVILNVGAYVAINQFYEQRFFGDDTYYYQKMTGESDYHYELAEYYFKLMRDITLLTLIFHECGHIYSGHLDYISTCKATATSAIEQVFLNADNISLLTCSPLRHQALEWNADDFSATRVVETIFGTQYWSVANLPCTLSFTQLFWVVANATLASYCLMGSKRESEDLRHGAHLPAKFRALAFLCTAEKKLQKWCGSNDITPPMIEAAIAVARENAEIYDINYKALLSAEEKLHYDLVEYELLVKLPVALINFQHLQCITPEMILHTMVRLYDAMSLEERMLFEKKVEAKGKHFPIDQLRYLANYIVD